jgi:hypothetical protein
VMAPTAADKSRLLIRPALRAASCGGRLRYVPVTGRLGTFLPISPLDLDLIGKRNRVRVTNRLECSV